MVNPLVADIEAFMQRFVVLPDEQTSQMLAVWVIHTWLIDAAQVTPYLYVYSSEPASGKTRLLEVLSLLCRNARRADDMTAPVMFKMIERELPTLLIDEVDTIWSGSRNDEKRRIINTGYRRGGSAWREQARELIEFSTFCPKVMSGLNNGFMPRTIQDRSIPIEMARRDSGDRLERFNETALMRSASLDELLDRIVAFKDEYFADITAQSPEPMTQLSDRQDEVSQPLLAIAAVCGIEQEMRDDLDKIFSASAGKSVNPVVVILGRIRDAFKGEEKMFTEDITTALGDSWNGRQLAIWLEPLGIGPMDVRIGNRVMRGYLRKDFESAWSTYLPSAQSGLRIVQSDNEEEEAA